MARPTLSRAAPWRIGVAALALGGAVALAGPAAVGAFSDGGGAQPPPGAPAVDSDAENAPNTQPPAGAEAVTSDAKNAPNTQPANLNPKPAGKPTTVKGPKEKSGPAVDAQGRDDTGGVDGADTGDRDD